jgi:hypothetical protein
MVVDKVKVIGPKYIETNFIVAKYIFRIFGAQILSVFRAASIHYLFILAVPQE